MRVQLNREVIVQSSLIPPTWYPCECAKVEHNEAADKSEYDRIYFKVLDGEWKGKMIDIMSSEKFTSAEILQMYEALLGIKIDKDFITLADGKKIKPEDFPEVNHDDLIGKRCMVKTTRGEYNNKPQDKIEGFRPMVKAA